MYGSYHAHPMACRSTNPMGGFLDDIWGDVSKAAETQAAAIIKQAPAQIASAAAGAVANNSAVKQAAAQSATTAAINTTAAKLTALKQKIAAQFTAFIASPIGWLKANPGTALTVVGTIVGIGAGAHFLMKGIRE